MAYQRFAIIDAGRVFNVVVVLDGQTPPPGAIGLGPDDRVSPGDYYDGEEFTPAPPPPSGPFRVSKADFQRLFAPTERYAINALRKEVAALVPADYTDPAKTLLVAAEDVLFAFEQPLEFIELDHPETAQGLALLSYLDVIDAARIPEILANQMPV